METLFYLSIRSAASLKHYGQLGVIGRYDRNEVKPSIETAARMANALGVSLDYLTGLSNQELDQDLVKQINELQTLKTEDRQHILQTLGALIREAKTRLTFG